MIKKDIEFILAKIIQQDQFSSDNMQKYLEYFDPDIKDETNICIRFEAVCRETAILLEKVGMDRSALLFDMIRKQYFNSI